MVWSETKGIRTVNSVDEFKDAYAEEGSRVWIDLQDPDKDLLLALGETLGLHPLVTEDILERNQRAKVEITGDALHVVLFSLTYEGEVLAHEIDAVMGKRFVLTAHDADVDFKSRYVPASRSWRAPRWWHRLPAVADHRLGRRRLLPGVRPPWRRD